MGGHDPVAVFRAIRSRTNPLKGLSVKALIEEGGGETSRSRRAFLRCVDFVRRIFGPRIAFADAGHTGGDRTRGSRSVALRNAESSALRRSPEKTVDR